MEGKRTGPSDAALYSVASSASLIGFLMGTTIAWPSPTIPKLLKTGSENPLGFVIDKHQMGWLFSLISLGSMISCFFAGRLTDWCGRKNTMLVACITFSLSYMAMVLVNDLTVMYIARFLQGIGCGLTMTVLPIYFGEISTKERRGAIGCIFIFFSQVGKFFVYCIGPFTKHLTWQVVIFCISLIWYGLYFYIPESPIYLNLNNREAEAIKSMQKIRRQDENEVKKELEALTNANRPVEEGKKCEICIHPGYRKALIIVLGLMWAQQFSGAVAIVINTQQIFTQAQSSLDPAMSTILVGFIQVISSLSLQFIADKFKRRTLLRCSLFFAGLSQLTTGTYFYLKSLVDMYNFRWIPVLNISIFYIAYYSGIGLLPFSVLSELFPAHVKGFAASCAILTCWLLGFMIVKAYPLVDACGSEYVFWTFGICCAAGFLFVQFYMFETWGLTVQEIQDKLNAVS